MQLLYKFHASLHKLAAKLHVIAEVRVYSDETNKLFLS